MRITLTDAGKRFNRDWIFRHFNYQFNSSHAYAITGPNGSGKSTLLQFIAGALMPSEGSLSCHDGEGRPLEDMYRHLSIVAPYLETIEEMTAREFLDFHHQFKPLLPGLSPDQILSRTGLGGAAGKQIRYFSSGMKQRLKLAQAIFSDTEILLMDEPTTNLDAPGTALYHELVQEFAVNRMVIVSSNDPQEYSFCKNRIEMSSLKG